MGSQYIDVLRYWGQVCGDDLAEHGVHGVPEDEYRDTEVWMIGAEIVKVTLNTHPLDHRPYYKAVWRAIPGQFRGTTPVSQVTHLEDICNASMRALVKNMGVAAGPQVVVMIDQLPQGETELTSIYPLKVWQMTSKPGSNGEPVRFFQPQSNARELIGVFQHYWELAGDITGIYRYNYGSDSGMQGAAQTMQGLAMLLENSSKIIRHAVQNIENSVVARRVRDQFYLNMMYEPDESIKGDLDVIIRGSSAIIEKASIRQRRVELLTMMNNIPETQALGTIYSKIRLGILTDTAKELDIDPDNFPAEDEIVQALEAMAQQASQQPKDPRVEAAEISANARIEDQQLEMQDRVVQREHQLKIKTMELQGLREVQDSAGSRQFDQKKMELTADITKLRQKQAAVQAELGLKQQGKTGI